MFGAVWQKFTVVWPKTNKPRRTFCIEPRTRSHKIQSVLRSATPRDCRRRYSLLWTQTQCCHGNLLTSDGVMMLTRTTEWKKTAFLSLVWVIWRGVCKVSLTVKKLANTCATERQSNRPTISLEITLETVAKKLYQFYPGLKNIFEPPGIFMQWPTDIHEAYYIYQAPKHDQLVSAVQPQLLGIHVTKWCRHFFSEYSVGRKLPGWGKARRQPARPTLHRHSATSRVTQHRTLIYHGTA